MTALAKRNIWTGIYTIGKKGDYLYSDTDSLKILHYERHQKYIDSYNKIVEHRLKTMCKRLKIDFSLCAPKTIKGETKMLGVYDFEGVYDKFRTLGAKRYMTYKDGQLSYTIAGCGKIKGVPYLIEKFKNNIDEIFSHFNDDFYIPSEYTMKQTHTYVDEGFEADVIDYLGVKCHIKEKSFIHLEPCEFNLSIGHRFIEYLKTFRKDLF